MTNRWRDYGPFCCGHQSAAVDGVMGEVRREALGGREVGASARDGGGERRPRGRTREKRRSSHTLPRRAPRTTPSHGTMMALAAVRYIVFNRQGRRVVHRWRARLDERDARWPSERLRRQQARGQRRPPVTTTLCRNSLGEDVIHRSGAAPALCPPASRRHLRRATISS